MFQSLPLTQPPDFHLKSWKGSQNGPISYVKKYKALLVSTGSLKTKVKKDKKKKKDGRYHGRSSFAISISSSDILHFSIFNV
jgi:hypothetical protein